MNFLERLLGIGQPTRTINTGGKVAQYAPLTPQQQQLGNAKIAADGARMYQQAHPGRTYVPGQNGETYAGGLNQAAYQQQVSAPMTRQTIPAAKPAYNGMTIRGSFAPPQNPGFIPLQGSRGVAPIQGGYL